MSSHLVPGTPGNLSAVPFGEADSAPHGQMSRGRVAAAAAGAASLGAAALLWAWDERLGLSNDMRFIKGELDFTIQSRRHIFFQHTVADVWEETVAANGAKTAIVFATASNGNSNNNASSSSKKEPERPAGAPSSFTFDTVNRQANRLCSVVSSQSLPPGSTVALLMTNRPEFLWSSLALSKAGCTVSFLNYNLKPSQLAHCVSICDAAAILYEDCFDGVVAETLAHLAEKQANGSLPQPKNGLPPKRLRYATTLVSPAGPSAAAGAGPSVSSSSSSSSVIHVASWLPLMSDANPPRTLRKGLHMMSPWGFVYTSGTTGLPKAAVITNLRYFMAGYLMTGITGVGFHDRVYTALPLYHSAGGMIGVGSMVFRGATLILSPKFSATRFWEDISTHGATVTQYIGELCRYLVGAPPHPKERAHKLRMAIGNGMRPDVWPRFQARFNVPIVSEFYASTEGNASLVNVCTKPADQGAVGHFGIIVRALGLFKIARYDENTDSLVRGPDGRCQECKAGEIGELLGLLRLDDKTGLRTFAGYHGNKEATEKKIARGVFAAEDAWFRTGDLLRMSAEGRYYFVDRIGDTFRWRGENVATTEVAEVVSGFPGISEANVYGVAIPGYEGRAGMAALVLQGDEREGEDEAVAAIVEGEGEGPPPGHLPPTFDLNAFAAYLKENLPAYAVPLFVRVLPHVPVTSTFKHVKKDLRDEGADPTLIKDELFWLNAKEGGGNGNGGGANGGGTYERLTLSRWHEIVAGKARL